MQVGFKLVSGESKQQTVAIEIKDFREKKRPNIFDDRNGTKGRKKSLHLDIPTGWKYTRKPKYLKLSLFINCVHKLNL